MISFFIPGEPIAKGRGRAAVVAGRAHVFTPAKTRGYENLVKELAAMKMDGGAPTDQPVRVEVVVQLPVPKSMSKRDRKLLAGGAIWPAKRPDLDNCVKAVTDGMNKIVFCDDNQICMLVGRKIYSDIPGVRVEVTLL